MFPFLTGFATGGGLIVAIGAQNAYILRLGLMRTHVFACCLICALADAVLILLGVAGLGALVEASPALLTVIRFGGAAFLTAYGIFALRRMLKPDAMDLGQAKPPALRTAIATVLAFTFLNPHVYLDTVVLMGSISASFGADRWWFGAGGMVASFVWFFGLGYGARLLAPVFQRPTAWRVLDAIIALVMFTIAAGLLFSG
ncbi:MAG: LysE/ArgO family amino acid transporter [Pseudomonadota bacterium]